MKFVLISAGVAATCALTVFLLMNHREHIGQLEHGQLHGTQQKPGNPGLQSETASGDSPPPTQSPPQALRQQPTAAVNDLKPPRRSSSTPSSRTASAPGDGIAKTHAELLSLERQGTRTYTEFALTRSRHFQMVGPLEVQLRKADTKHGSYDLTLTIYGRRLEKKHVNLYEPIWITLDEYAGPSEFVVNGISKNEVWGYLSEPRNRNSELAQKRSATARSSPQHRNP